MSFVVSEDKTKALLNIATQVGVYDDWFEYLPNC